MHTSFKRGNMMKYEDLELEVVYFEEDDVITASNETPEEQVNG